MPLPKLVQTSGIRRLTIRMMTTQMGPRVVADLAPKDLQDGKRK